MRGKLKDLHTIAYEIRDKHLPGGVVAIKKSTKKAWWMDRGKVEEMIKGRKMGMKWVEVRILCGITEDEQKGFFEVHPELKPIFKDLEKYPHLLVRQSIYTHLTNKDKEMTKFYAERKMPEEFKEKKDIDVREKPLLIDDVLGDVVKIEE